MLVYLLNGGLAFGANGLFPAGSAAFPSISFLSENTKGFYSFGLSTVGFSTGGIAAGIIGALNGGIYVQGSPGNSYINFPNTGNIVLNATAAANVVIANSPIVNGNYTVAGLPAAAAINTYGIAFISDAVAAAGTLIGTVPVGGGAVKRAVYSTGAAWLLL